ncbi:hypothetical protein ACC689_36305, partial [Rhizobium ruizarguesonis]
SSAGTERGTGRPMKKEGADALLGVLVRQQEHVVLRCGDFVAKLRQELKPEIRHELQFHLGV